MAPLNGPSQAARLIDVTDPLLATVMLCVGQYGDTAADASVGHNKTVNSNK
jgi:hypothetical protein